MKKIEDDGMFFGEVIVDIKKVMSKKGVSRTRLSKLSNIKYDIINKYYKGNCKQVDLGTIAKICYILDCEVNEILKYELSGVEFNEQK